MGILSYLKSKDNLGAKVGFTIDSSDNHQTVIGGILSIFVFLANLYFFIVFSQDMILKENPSGIEEIRENKGKDKKFELSDNFTVGFRLTNWDGSEIDLFEYFFPIFEFQKISERGENVKSIIVDAVPCDMNKTKANVKDNKNETSIDPKMYLCPDISKLENEKLFGTFADEKLNILTFSLSLYNGTQSKNISKVIDFFKENEVLTSVLNTRMDYFVTKNESYTVKWSDDYNFLSNNNFLYEKINLRMYELEEDTGFLLEDKSDKKLIAVDDIRTFSNPRDPERLLDNYKKNIIPQIKRDRDFYVAEIFYDSNKKYFFRKYTKIADVFANVLGMRDFIGIFVFFFMECYGKLRLDGYVCQRLIYIEDEIGKNFSGKEFGFSSEEIQKNKKTLKNKFKPIDDISKSNINNNNIELKEIIPEEKSLKENEYNNNDLDSNKHEIGVYERASEKKIVPKSKSSSELIEIKKDIKNNIQKNDEEQSKEIRNYLEISFNKFWAFKNKLENKMKNLFIFTFCPKSNLKLRSNYEIITKYSEKIYENFDIFYYMQQLKKFEYMQEIIYSKKERNFLDTMTKKFYRAWLTIENKEETEEIKERNMNDLNYIMDANYENTSENEKIIMGNFIN